MSVCNWSFMSVFFLNVKELNKLQVLLCPLAPISKLLWKAVANSQHATLECSPCRSHNLFAVLK